MTEAFQRKCGRCGGTGAIRNIAGLEVTCLVYGGKGWNRMR